MSDKTVWQLAAKVMEYGELPLKDATKSHVGLLECPWCGEATGVLLDRRLRNSLEHHNKDLKPCEKCMKNAIIMYDKDTNAFIGYGKKDKFMDAKSLEKFKDTPVKAMVKIEGDHIQFFNPPGG